LMYNACGSNFTEIMKSFHQARRQVKVVGPNMKTQEIKEQSYSFFLFTGLAQ